jgi:hypothetical protein
MTTKLPIKTFAPSSHKIKAVVYGASGSGKTYFAATAPKPIFASAEAGLLSTVPLKKKIDYVEIKTVADLRNLLLFLKNEKHEYETVVIDSISEINELKKEELERDRHGSMIQKDWGELLKVLKQILRQFRGLDMHVLFIAQETPLKDDQRTEKIVPELNGKAATQIARYMDIVGYSYIDKNGDHKILIQPHEKYLTKVRGVEIPDDAPTDFSFWVDCVSKLDVHEEEIKEFELSTQPQNPSIQNRKIQPDQTKEIQKLWAHWIELNQKDDKKSTEIFTNTLQKYFDKKSIILLTEGEAEQLITKIKTANQEIINKKKAVDKSEKNPDQESQKPEECKTPVYSLLEMKNMIQGLKTELEISSLKSEFTHLFSNNELKITDYEEAIKLIEERIKKIQEGKKSKKSSQSLTSK